MDTRRRIPGWCVAAGLAVGASLGGAATNTWKGAANGDWFATNNWTALVVPSDGDDVIVTNSSILLTNATANLASFTITNATMTFTNWLTALNATELTIKNAGTLTHGTCVSNNTMTNHVWIVATNITIEAGGKIDVTGKGYSTGPGFQGHQRAGAGYGGRGGYCSGPGGVAYGSPWAPLDPGSGAGAGHRGGGAVLIEATGHVLVNGTIKANGEEFASGWAGEGSGGGVYMSCRTFAGTNGLIYARGDDAGTESSGGGGGRIAICFDTVAQTSVPRPTVRIDTGGGALGDGNIPAGSYAGELGSVYLSDGQLIPAFMRLWNAQLYGPTNWSWPEMTMSTSTIRMGGPYNVANTTLDVGGNLTMLTNSTLALYSGTTNTVWTNYGARVTVSNDLLIASNSWVYLYSHTTNGGSARFEVSNLLVQATAGIDAGGKGYAVGYGPGRGIAAGARQGGAYGGFGGGAALNNRTYGSSNAPADCGSPGYASAGVGGSGGGLLRVAALGTVTMHGTLNADGANVGGYNGAGSGGGIFVTCRRLEGDATGSIRARGGNGTGTDSAGGGGGRIAVWASEFAYFGAYSVTNGATLAGYTIQGTPGTLVLSNVVVAGSHTLNVSANPAQHDAPSPPYGNGLVADGTWVTNTVTTPADSAGGVRYSCLGWALTNAAGLVSSGSTAQAEFQVTENLWFTWNWTTEYYLATSPATNGALTADRTGWYTNATAVTLQAVPDAGYYFLQWSGDIPDGSRTNNPLTVTMNQPRTIIGHFASNAPQSKAWTGTGDWFSNWGNWSPAGAPGLADAATVSSGQPTLRDTAGIGSLAVLGGTGVVMRGVNPVSLTVAGNVLVSNSAAALTVSNAPLTCGGDLTLRSRGAFTAYSGPTNATVGPTGLLVRVGGAMFVGSNCWVYPHSDRYNGGSPAFIVGSLTVQGTSGGFDASAKGFAVGYGPGRGGDGRPGGAYGGRGGGSSIANTSLYGSSNAPADPGSPGESGRGGGLIRVAAVGNIGVDGVLNADGQSGSSGYFGAGSGGGIHLTCWRITGGTNGVIFARGGDPKGNDSGGGGGGRIAIWAVADDYAGQISVTNGPSYLNHSVSGTIGTIVRGRLPRPGTVIMMR